MIYSKLLFRETIAVLGWLIGGIEFQNLVDSTCGQIIHPVESVRWELSDRGSIKGYKQLHPKTRRLTHPLI